jgi:hypothetical protein
MHPRQDCFRKGFYMHPTCTFMLAKNLSLQKECYKPTPLEESHPQDSGSAWK